MRTRSNIFQNVLRVRASSGKWVLRIYLARAHFDEEQKNVKLVRKPLFSSKATLHMNKHHTFS